MIRKFINIFIVLNVISNTVISQATPEESIPAIWWEKPKISSDSLLKMFESMDVFEVLDKIRLSYVDFYDCYYDSAIKPYVLKWLDKEEYFKYLNEKSIKLTSENYIKNEIIELLKRRKQDGIIDSVLKTPELFQLYLDSVIIEETKIYRRQFFRKGGRLSYKALDFHAHVKLPEAYEILYRYWVEDGKRINSNYIFTLLAMHDPEAITKYNAYVDSLILANDLYRLENIKYNIAFDVHTYGSYSVDLLLKLLTVITRTLYQTLDNSYDIPFNIALLSPLEGYCYLFTQGEYASKIVDMVYGKGQKINSKDYSELEKISIEIRDNIEEFRYSIQPFKEALIKREEYWKKNMPYMKREGGIDN